MALTPKFAFIFLYITINGKTYFSIILWGNILMKDNCLLLGGKVYYFTVLLYCITVYCVYTVYIH